MQRTIRSAALIKGIGLQTGKRVELKLRPAPPDRGIVFIRSDMPGDPEIRVCPQNLHSAFQRTALKRGRAEIHTVEHILAALSALYIDNVVIEINNVELPGLDGSAKEFVGVLRDAGLHMQDVPRNYIETEKPIICSDDKGTIQIIPDEHFKIEYFLDYDHKLLKEQWSDIILDGSEKSMDFFEREIAPARTFCLERDAMTLLKLGLGKGADFSNTLVINAEGPINNRFRFPDEPVRHKVLDLLGDLYVLGRHIKGRIVARKSGHKLNSIFIKRLKEESEKLLTKIA